MIQTINDGLSLFYQHRYSQFLISMVNTVLRSVDKEIAENPANNKIFSNQEPLLRTFLIQ